MMGDSRPVVRTRYGWVRGFRRRGAMVFRGVPYGGPTAERRFRPPVPPTPWTNVRDAAAFGPMAPQNGTSETQLWEDPRIGEYVTGGRARELIEANVPTGEDCLVLNVLTPASSGSRPVMVFLHGGGLEGCSGTEQALSETFVQEQDVVLVTVNHRLNVFGFLYLGELSEDYATANVGLLDLVLALEWVRDNIENFGGDPGNVTIFGPSGGGTKVLTLMGMKAAAGLFHRAIVHSCGPPTPIPAASATATAKELLARLGVGVGELAELPAEVILRALKAGDRLRFRAVVDARTISEPLWRDGVPECARGIPLIIGNCQDEMSFFVDFAELEWAELVARLASFTGLAAAALTPVVDVFAATQPAASAREIFIAVMSGRSHAVGNAIAEMHGSAPTYLYRFAFDTQIGDLKAFHTAEVPLCTRLVLQPDAEALSRQMSAAWAGFARTGDPNHSGMPAWPPYELPSRVSMVFDRESRAVSDLARAEREAMARLPLLSNG